MSSNYVHYCEYCEKIIKDFIKNQKGKISEGKYKKLEEVKTVDELLPFLPEKWIFGNIDRLEGSDLDYEFVEDWGEGIRIGDDGNLHISISGSCDFCGKEFHYEIILPETSRTKKIDLTKREVK